jgi:peptidoglycan/LPS O-acetylase OafA/YrhL
VSRPVNIAEGPGSAPVARSAALDGLRAIAILWVFAFHAQALLGGGLGGAEGGTLANLAETGLLGVQFFFVLSGFLLALPWMRAERSGYPAPSMGRFYRRRAGRILPAFYLHLAVLFGLILPVLHGGLTLLGDRLGLLNLLTHASLLHFLHPGSASSLGVNMALWSLSIEAQFYLLLPLLAPLFTGRRVWIALPVAVVFSLLWKTTAPALLAPWLWQSIPPDLLIYFDPVTGARMPYPPGALALFVERQFPGEFMAFAFGMAAANVATRVETARIAPGHPARDTRLEIAALTLLAVWAVVLSWVPFSSVLWGTNWRLYGMPMLLLSVAFLVLVAHLGSRRPPDRMPLLDFALGNRVLAGMGMISYSLFLWHEPLLRLVRVGWIALPGVTSPALQVALGLAIAIVVASVSFWAVERPVLKRPSDSAPGPR